MYVCSHVYACVWRPEITSDGIPSHLFCFFEDCIFSVLAFMFICASHACIVQGGQKRVLDPLEMELKVVVSCLVSVGNRASREPLKSKECS